jgi:signal transduction histidine kinase
VAAVPDSDPNGVRRVAKAMAGESDAVCALGLTSGSGEVAVQAARDDKAHTFDGSLVASATEPAGARLLPLGDKQALALFTPLPAGAEPAGRAVSVIDAEAIFSEAGLHDPDSGLTLTLTAAEVGAPEGARAVYLGHAAVLEGDPVSVGVGLPGGEWQLAAVPSDGWVAGAAWPIRIATLLSAGLVAAPMLRNGRRRRRNAEVLAGSAENMLGAAGMGAWTYDIDSGVLTWDARMEALHGLPADGAARTCDDWRARVHPEDLPRPEAAFMAAIRRTGRFDTNFRVRLPGGGVRHVRTIGAVRRDRDGSARMEGVGWDITADIRRMEEIEAGRCAAEQASAAKSQFLATISHEVRSPLAGLSGMLDLLLDTSLDATQRERAQVARSSARHLLALLDDLLDLSKIEANRIDLAPEEVDVGRLAQEVVVLVSAGLKGRELDLTCKIGGTLPDAVTCDPKRLRQVLLNLVGNAVKFTESGSVELQLGYELRSGQLNVAVCDTGVGIPDDARAGLFRRFVQGDSPLNRARGGSGLGLAISKELVELMGGEIRCDSVPGFGSTFRFWIPAPADARRDLSATA